MVAAKKVRVIAAGIGLGLILGTSGILPKGSDAYHLALQVHASVPG